MSDRKREITTTFRPGTLLLCLMLIGVPAVQASQEFEQHLAEGRELLENKDFREAIKAFEAANELADGEAEEPLLGLATAHYRLAQYQKVIDISEALLQHATEKRTLANAYNLLGVSLYMKDDRDIEGLEKAESALRNVIDLVGDEGDSIEPRLSLAFVLQALNRKREAAENLQAILDAEPAGESALGRRTRVQLCRMRYSLEKFLPEGAPPDQEGYRSEPAGQEEHGGSVERQGTEESGERRYVGGDVQPPMKISTPQPQYSVAARRDRIQGVVIAQAIINRMGCVTNVKILKGLDPDLDKNAVMAISNWVFEPATLEGKPVDVYYNLTVNFRLQRKQ